MTNYRVEEGLNWGVYGFILGALLRLFSEPISRVFFGAPVLSSTAAQPWWGGHAALAQIALLMMFFSGLLCVVAFSRVREP